MEADYSTRPRPGLLAQAGWLLLALAVAGGTARLGFWQLSRAHQKEARAALMAERGALPPIPAQALAQAAADVEAQSRRRVVLRGHWLAARTIYLANRTMDGRVGFDVLTPLELATGDAVVVQRGWALRDDADPQRLPTAVRTATGEVVVRGWIAPLPERWVSLGAEGQGPIRQNLDLAALGREAGVALRPLIVVEEADAADPSDGLSRHWPEPTLGVERNYGYAVQWFAMSATAVAIFLWFRILRPARRAPT